VTQVVQRERQPIWMARIPVRARGRVVDQGDEAPAGGLVA